MLEKIFQRYGFDPIETPIVEYWDTLKGKYGREAEEKLIWRFQLPYSEREYALRYDLTVPLARFYARFKPRIPFKRYHIGRVYRYDRPQKGRYREFWQADFDIVGVKNPVADAEVLDVVYDVFVEVGFSEFEIRVNDRRLLKGVFEETLGIQGSLLMDIYRAIDSLDKIGLNGVINELKGIGLKDEDVNRIVDLIRVRGKEEILDTLESKFSTNRNVLQAISDLRTILDYSKAEPKIKIDLSLVRGLDYYTGMIYEVWSSKFSRALSGGGRYDNLIGIFEGSDVPAVGGSIGVEPLIDVGLEAGIFKLDTKTYTQIGVVYIGSTYREAWEIARRLREAGYNTYLDLMGRDFKKQMKYLVEKGIRYLVIVGERDLKEGVVTFQDRETRERIKVPLKSLEENLSKILV